MMRKTRILLAAASIVALTACSEGLGAGMGEAALNMSRTDDAPMMLTSTEPSSEPQSVSSDTVESFEVTITSIQFLRADAEEADANGWVTLNFDEGVTVDLMALPDSGIAALVAEGSVEAGAYSAVRLFVTSPKMVFRGDIEFGLGNTLEGGVEYDVTIPSSAQSGIEVFVDFEIDVNAETDVNLLFDSALSLTNLTVTGASQIIVNPVIRGN
jgi:hypothetical protein